MAKKLALKSFRLKNFKAIQDSGVVKFTPLTVLIGDNGSGKSSLVEGLRTYQKIVTDGLDAAMGMWRGFEYIANMTLGNQDIAPSPSIEFELRGSIDSKAFGTTMRVGSDPITNKMLIEKECVYLGRRKLLERGRAARFEILNGQRQPVAVRSDISVIAPWIVVADDSGEQSPSDFESISQLLDSVLNWQFLALDPHLMGEPLPARGSHRVRLRENARNIAEYLLDIRRRDGDAFDGIIEAMQFVLPYMRDLKPQLTSELERSVYLQMQEDDFNVPGWLLSTGTLRILALLALFRHPEPPPLIVIEELENGLDPRTVQLIVEEIRRVTESGRSQIILTSHSPYLLDLFDLEHIVLVERRDLAPTFTRPDECTALDRWKDRFGPGRLHSSGRLRNLELT